MKNLKVLRSLKGITQKELADYLGCTEQTVANYENGRRGADYETQLKIAEFFNVSLDYLFRGSSETDLYSLPGISPLPKMKKVPLLGKIACGEPILAVENIDSFICMPENVNGTFALNCKGDSMINARIFDGDVVYIREQPDVENGEIAAVLIGEEATLKRVYKYPSKLVLRPENPMYEDFTYSKDEINEVRILGKAVAFLSAVR